MSSLIRRLPLREMLRAFRALRRQWFTVPWPSGVEEVIVTEHPATAELKLRDRCHFESGMSMSYRYEGEVLNLRRPEGTRSLDWVADGRIVQLQLHIRAREVGTSDDGEPQWAYVGHVEADPDEHPRRHIDEVGFRWTPEKVRTVLREADVAIVEEG